jgi:hypothetical protein
MSEVKVNKISPRTNCGTVQLGDSGDTITIPAGATITNNGTQTGFGRTGAVDWDTTAKTASFTAVSGNGYFVNTTSGAITVTLPATPSAGDIVAVADYTRTWQTNNCIIGRNSEPIGGVSENAVLDVEGQAATFVYVDGTEGWINVQETETSQTGAVSFMAATGGTITTCGNCKIHTFTGPGTFTVCKIAQVCAPTRNNVSYLVVAGGGGGGGCAGGGGGAGGFREFKAPLTPYTASPLDGNPGGTSITVTAQAYPITVGGGGLGQDSPCSSAQNGNNSTFSTVTSAGGGGGGGRANPVPSREGDDGGSGGGNSADFPNCRPQGNTPPVSPPQGQNGGTNPSPGTFNQGGNGGGGATACGGDEAAPEPASTKAVNGGAGATTSITGSPVAYAGGGGAGGYSAFPGGGGCGGVGGGGRGARPSCSAPASFAVAGTANTGGGGGAGSNQLPGCNGKGSAGGSGVVIIRYKYQ